MTPQSMTTAFVACPHCGTRIHPIASRCKRCRAEVPRATPPPGPSIDPATVHVASRPGITLAMIGLGGVAVAALGFAVWSRFADSDAEAAPAPSITPAAAPVKPPTKPADPYDRIAGRWRGIGHQTEPRVDWDVDMRIDNPHAATGEKVGTVEYPTLGCSGDLFRRPAEGDLLVIDEKITVNPRGICVAEGTIKVSRTGDELEWIWYFTSGTEAARARLTRGGVSGS